MPETPLHILLVSGSASADSATRGMLGLIAAELQAAGATIDLLDLATEPLSVFNPDTASTAAHVASLRDRIARADALVLGTPDYHGSMSGALKNFLDHGWREFAGKLFVPVVASYDKGLTVADHLRTVARQCYAWALPYALTFADKADWKDGKIASDGLRARVTMLVRDVRVYGQLLASQRRADLAGAEPGFLARMRS